MGAFDKSMLFLLVASKFPLFLLVDLHLDLINLAVELLTLSELFLDLLYVVFFNWRENEELDDVEENIIGLVDLILPITEKRLKVVMLFLVENILSVFFETIYDLLLQFLFIRLILFRTH